MFRWKSKHKMQVSARFDYEKCVLNFEEIDKPKQKASKKSQKSAKAAASCKTAIRRIVKSQKPAKAAASCKTVWTAL